MCEELRLRGVECLRQVPITVVYKGRRLECRLIIDILVAGLVIIECKATEAHHSIFESQLLTYLRVADKRLDLVVNFGQRYVKDGIMRVVNGLKEHPIPQHSPAS